MIRFSYLASATLAALCNVSQAADWSLTFTGSYVAWSEDAANYPLTDLHLTVTTEDHLSTSTASFNLGEGYKITGFTGTRNGEAITALLTPNDPDFYYFGIDSYLYPHDPQIVGGAGLGYMTADGTLFNLYGFTATFVNPPEVQWWELTSHQSLSPYSPYVTFNGQLSLSPVVAVPEPASLALMLGGVALVGGVARRSARG